MREIFTKKSPHFLCRDNRKVAKRYFYVFVLGAIVSARLLKSGNEFGVADELSKSRELTAPFINFKHFFEPPFWT